MQKMTEIYISKHALAAKAVLPAALICGLTIFGTTSAHAQMVNQPWEFTQQNRASIAALMKQTEDRETTQAATAVAGGYDQLICGKDGASSATGNNTCIIMNNSDGVIQIGQDAQGDQSATSNTETTEVKTMSDALENIGSANP